MYNRVLVDPLLTQNASAQPSADRELAVVVDNVCVRFEVDAESPGQMGRSTVTLEALSGISFSIYQGDALGLVGHNGAGKSTLLRVIAGLLPVTSGSVGVRSQPQLLGVQAALNPKVSGIENVELGCLALGIPRTELGDKLKEVVTFTGLAEYIRLPVRTYSSGMRARLSFAIACCALPEILLIDEALAVGDAEFRAKSAERLKGIRQSAGAVVLASHANEEIRRTCNKTLWLHQGRMVDFGPTERVISAFKKSAAGL